MNENWLTKRNRQGTTWSTAISIAWMTLLGGGVGFYLLYMGGAWFDIRQRILFASFSIIMAPIAPQILTDLHLRYKAGNLAKKMGAAIDGTKDRSKLGVTRDGKMVLFITDNHYSFKEKREKYVTGRVQVMPLTDEFRSLHKSVQEHLEWNALMYAVFFHMRTVLMLANSLLLSTSPLLKELGMTELFPALLIGTLWILALFLIQDFLWMAFIRKGQRVFFLGEDEGFEEANFSMFRPKQFELYIRYLKQEGMSKTIKGVMLDGSLLLEVKRRDTTIEYALLNRI